MDLIIPTKYFGDQKRMTEFVDGVIKEIRAIDETGRKKSREPSRYLADCHEDLLTLLIILEGYRDKLNGIEYKHREELEREAYTPKEE